MSSAEKQQRKAARKLPGKDQGLTFWQCFAKDRLYTKDMPGIRPYLYIIPFFLAYFVLDFSLRYTYRSAGIVGVEYGPAWLFTLGWALVFAGLVFCLPKVPRWFVRCVPLVTFVTIAVTHSGFMSMFRRFFSFSVLTYGGTGSFMQASYIHIALKVVAGATVTVLLMMTSGRLLKVIPPKPVKLSVILGLVAAVLGAALWVQIVLFFVVSIAALAATRPLVQKMLHRDETPTNADRVLGQTARVTETIDNTVPTGAVYADGKTWTARSASGRVIPKDTLVKVQRMEGVRLFVEEEAAQPVHS